MLPKWFNDWNMKNPTDIYGPAILVGTLGGAVFVAALLVTWGQPLATDSMQTGPRGTGMSVAERVTSVTMPDPTLAGMLQADAITAADIEAVSAEARGNVPPALEGLPADQYARLVVAMRSWTGIPDLMEDPDNYQTQVAYQMVEMTQNINESWIGHVQANAEVGVTCYTCHRGEAVPSEIWFRIGAVNEAAGGWAAVQNRAAGLTQYTSLPADALEKYLLEDNVIAVHDLESRVEGGPAGDDPLPSIQNTERTYALMNYFSNSLGVNCVFCHNSRAFYDGAQNTPQWATASLGILMVQELNNDYLLPLEGTLPAERLGPIYADVPKVACKTCHKGYQQPLQGTNVIADWPELASTEVVVSQ